MISERLKQVAEYQKLSISGLEKIIGASEGVIRRSIKNKTDIQSKWITAVSDNFPNIRAEWLLTGAGDMVHTDSAHPQIVEEPPSPYNAELQKSFNLKTDNSLDNQHIPLYNLEATAGIVPLFKESGNFHTDEYLSIPRLPKCDGAIFITGDSMYPLLKSGDIVAYKKITDFVNEVFYGEMYIVAVDLAGEEYTSVKFVHKSDKGERHIKLVSQNQHHQDKDIPLKMVRAMALVKASVRINSM